MTTEKPMRLRRRKPGDLGQLRRVLWGCLLELERDILDGDTNQRIRAAHALGTLSGSYLKATQASDLEARIEALEARAAGVSPIRRTA